MSSSEVSSINRPSEKLSTGLSWLHQGCQCEGDNREGVAGVPAEQVRLGEHGGPAGGGRPAGGARTLRLPQVWPPPGGQAASL